MLENLALSPSGDGVILEIVVQPRAARAGVAGLRDGALRLRVTAPPVDGAANAAVVKLVAELFQAPKSRVEIVGGQSSRRKRVRVVGLDAERARAQLAPLVALG